MISTKELWVKVFKTYWPVLILSVVLGLFFAGPTLALALVAIVLVSLHRKSIQWNDALFFKLFTIGISIRLGIIILKFAAHRYLGTDLSIFGDSGMHLTAANTANYLLAGKIQKTALPANMLIHGQYGYSITHWIYGGIYYVVGYSPFLLHVFNALFNCLAGLLLYLTTIRICNHKPAARFSMGLVMFMPSQIMWSVEMLKEPLIQCYAALIIFMFVDMIVNRKWSYLILLAFLWYPLGHIRKMTHIIMLATLGIASVFAFPRRLKTSVIIVLVLTSLAAVKLGPSGISTHYDAFQRRIILSQMGFITTGGSWYKYLPERMTPKNWAPLFTPKEFASSLVRSVAYYLLVPVPFKDVSFNKLPALPQMVVWYFLMFVCFIPGCLYMLRYHFRSSAIIFAYIIVFTVAQALFTGNEGTAFRQRDTVTLFYFIPIAIGFFNLRGWLAQRIAARRGPVEVSGMGGKVPDGIS